MKVARLIGVPPHVAGVDVVIHVVGGEPLHRRAKDRIHVAGACRQRRHEAVVGERSGRGRRMKECVGETGQTGQAGC